MKKQVNLAMLALVILTVRAQDTSKYCLEYPSLNDELQFKYCGSTILWPVKVDQMLSDELHDLALEKYKEVYQEYIKDPTNENQFAGVTVDCLGIMRKAFCSYYFPYCKIEEDTTEQIHINNSDGTVASESSEDTNTAKKGAISKGICNSLCDLIEARCPTVDVHSQICSNAKNEFCSRGRIIGFTSLIIGLMVVLVELNF
jgi:hypothetical protein